VADSNEAALQAIIEAFWHKNCISELCLVVDPKRDVGEGRFGFVDLFLASLARSFASCIPVVELKNITLKGILRATGNEDPTVDELSALRSELKEATRQNLLQRQFCYWDSNLGNYQKQSIQDLVDGAIEQVNKYLRVLEKGQINSCSKAGILHRRLRCENGADRLDGHVLVCIGGTRILVQKAGSMTTELSFQARHIR